MLQNIVNTSFTDSVCNAAQISLKLSRHAEYLLYQMFASREITPIHGLITMTLIEFQTAFVGKRQRDNAVV